MEGQALSFTVNMSFWQIVGLILLYCFVMMVNGFANASRAAKLQAEQAAKDANIRQFPQNQA